MQQRVGFNRKLFGCLKFRTMVPDAGDRLAAYLARTQATDPRSLTTTELFEAATTGGAKTLHRRRRRRNEPVKPDIHPKYYEAKVHCGSCGREWTVGSTREELRVDVCSNCHPFFTGTQNIIDTAGQVERFQKRHPKAEIIIKGIQTAEDAKIALDNGIKCVYVTNHGGRALDHARGAMDILPEVVDAVKGKVPIIIDGGFYRGTDVIKAIALGATAVGIGRLYCYALAAAGRPGIVGTCNDGHCG